MKDLGIFEGKDLRKVIIVDNTCSSFSNQLDNGVPIVPYFYREDDRELVKLRLFLLELYQIMRRETDDVREVLKEYFKLALFQKFESQDELFRALFPESEKGNC